MMKKMITVFMAVLMLFAFTACGGASGEGEAASDFDFEAPETVGDLLALEPSNMHQSTEDNTFYYGMEMDGSYYRFKAEMTQEQCDALFDIDYAADDAAEQEAAILSDLVITDRQKLDDQILSQEDLDALVGKTGQELLDAGWTPGYGYDLEAGEFWLFYGPFCYTIGFDGEFEESDDIIDDEDYFKDHTVTSATFNSLGEISNW